MTDTPTPTTTLTYAKAAASALREVQALPREQLAGNPADVYDLVDELLPAVFDLARICDRLAGQLNDWAGLAATHRRAGDLPQRLQSSGVAAGHAQRQPRCCGCISAWKTRSPSSIDPVTAPTAAFPSTGEPTR